MTQSSPHSSDDSLVRVKSAHPVLYTETYMRVVLSHVDEEANNIKTFWFKPEQPVDQISGQFIELTLQHTHPDSRGQKRWFTLSNAPEDIRGISITTKYAGDAFASSFKKALFALETGAELLMSQPMGDFVLPKNPIVPLVCVAAGIGITPFHSIFTWLTKQGEHRDIRFIYSVHNEEEILFQETFSLAGIHATIFVEEPSAAWGGERGRISSEQVLALVHSAQDSLFYISGPEPMVAAITEGLRAAGVPRHRLVADLFSSYARI